MDIASVIFKVSLVVYVVTLVVMYVILLKNDRKTSVYPPNICSNYATKTKEENGKIGLLYYLNHGAGIIALLAIIAPMVLSML